MLCCLLKHIEQDPDVLWYFDGCFMSLCTRVSHGVSSPDTRQVEKKKREENKKKEVEINDQIWTLKL